VARGSQTKGAFTRLRDDQREARRNAIIDAAEKVFATRPFSRVSMRDIAKEAGISPALIYRYFPDQQHLFVEAFLRGTKRLIAIFDEFLTGGAKGAGRAAGTAGGRKAGGDQGQDLVLMAARHFIDFLTEHEQYFKMMTHFMLEGTLSEPLRERLDDIERSMLDLFDMVFERAGIEGDTRILSHAFFASLNGILITFRQHPGRSPEQVREHMDRSAGIISDLFGKGLR
jgi:AcrR family transcriptional regulator